MHSPTTTTYGSLQEAYDFFNQVLFDDKLPACMITLRHKRSTLGYFYPERFKQRAAGFKLEAVEIDDAGILTLPHAEALWDKTLAQTCCEIALNATAFDRGDRDVLSTLVHEMCHLWQFYFSKPPSGGHHNREWGTKMEALGLIPSHTGAPGGQRTGTKMSHYIDDEGAYARAYEALVSDFGFKIVWGENPEAVGVKVARKNKIKYSCPDCGLNAWAKPQAKVACAVCSEQDEKLIIMDAVI